jgi:hypothetical protein
MPNPLAGPRRAIIAETSHPSKRLSPLFRHNGLNFAPIDRSFNDTSRRLPTNHESEFEYEAAIFIAPATGQPNSGGALLARRHERPPESRPLGP